MSSLAKKSILTVFFVLVADQSLKFFIKLHYPLGYDHPIFSWFHIYFIENNGMAFGMELFGKLFLSLFRIAASVFLIYYIVKIIKRNYPAGYVIAISLILAGAIGNLLDSMFYGVLFSDSAAGIAQLLPIGGGYAPLFYGRVVDMLYFPLIHGQLPSWVPFWGGEDFIFFRPIFNLADSAVTVGVFIILLFYRRYLSDTTETSNNETKMKE
ncbi:lipoprotein signal peptidase [Microbacter margulisiae]|uniref:Lipoprotein signal peptidase n=1 Tax=Microbacter margulisiae TaxID=1350067 RepID=A0A7W5DPJ9_9PORP|nr:lipoprotein signal peptidase [Microbacter margulisiae]MBB3186732.1 signal peptidase II [Microbacter margulisiae]